MAPTKDWVSNLDGRALDYILGGDHSIADARKYAPQIDTAERLSEFTDGSVEVKFVQAPLASLSDGTIDREATTGRCLYAGQCGDDRVSDWVRLDTRKPESLERQIVSELERIADEMERAGQFHREEARRLAAKLDQAGKAVPV
jgi:hypothetical protein